jgi:hypothetical protein
MGSVVPEIYDKQIIEIDMENAVKTNIADSNGDIQSYYCDFYVDIQQPIRNAVYIKIMRTAIVLKKPEVVVEGIAPTLQVNGEYILDDDAIYISMNNYNRISTVIKQTYSENVVIDVDTDDKGNKIEIKEIQSVTKPTVFEYFDVIHTNIASTFALFNKNTISIEVDIPTALFKNEYQQSAFDPNDTSVYILNPIEPSLKRFNIELRDKKNQLLKTSEIASFKMTICVYSKQKKF